MVHPVGAGERRAMTGPPRVLLILAECNPEWASVPRFGYALFDALQSRADVMLVTHIRNRAALARVTDIQNMVFIPESRAVARYYALIYRLSMRGRLNWPLLHFLGYPLYAEFNRRVLQTMQRTVRSGKFDVVHAYTPVTPRYPYSIVNACEQTPFILGPVNGGLPFPKAFQKVGRAEFSYLHPLRDTAHLLPGYRRTYRRAAKILAGSAYTYTLVQRMFRLEPARLALLHDTGVDAEAFLPRVPHSKTPTRLLFVGRLVPGKGVDMLLEAMNALETEMPGHFTMTIVGDGQEKQALEHRAGALGISERVRFIGWVRPAEVGSFYQNADIFCFPSVREFGGAVVLEAMAAGLPCLVADYGGISEFVTAKTGIKLSIASREDLVRDLVSGIRRLGQDVDLLSAMSCAATIRAREFTWDAKAERLLEIYADTLESKRNPNLAAG